MSDIDDAYDVSSAAGRSALRSLIDRGVLDRGVPTGIVEDLLDEVQRAYAAGRVQGLLTYDSLCVECGPNVRVDEDGCCVTCGATATGAWLRACAKGEAP